MEESELLECLHRYFRKYLYLQSARERELIRHRNVEWRNLNRYNEHVDLSGRVLVLRIAKLHMLRREIGFPARSNNCAVFNLSRDFDSLDADLYTELYTVLYT
jgi:hypothetical protein